MTVRKEDIEFFTLQSLWERQLWRKGTQIYCKVSALIMNRKT